MAYDHETPNIISPHDDVCVPLRIPNDSMYINQVVAALSAMTLDRWWVRDEQHSAIEARRTIYTRTLKPLLAALENGEYCPIDFSIPSDKCTSYAPASPIVNYAPSSPFSDVIPDGFLARPFQVFSSSSAWVDDFLNNFGLSTDSIVGLEDGDIFTTLGNVPIPVYDPLQGFSYNFQVFRDYWNQALSFNVPRFWIEVSGTGTVELHLLNIPLGGVAYILKDFDNQSVLESFLDIAAGTFALSDDVIIVELNRDISSVPIEKGGAIVIEVEFEEGGSHRLDVVFGARIDDNLSDFGFGGGLRKIVLCGFDAISNPRIGDNCMTEKEMYDALIRYEAEKAKRFLLAGYENLTSPEATIKSFPSYDDSNTGSDGGFGNDTGVLYHSVGGGIQGSQLEQKNGGAYNVARKFADIFTKINSYRVGGYSLSVIQQLIGNEIGNSDSQTYAAIEAIFYDASATTLNIAALAQSVFEKGIGGGISAYLANSGLSESKIGNGLGMSIAIPDATKSSWFDEGRLQPRSEYLGYASTLAEPVSFVVRPESFTGQLANIYHQSFVLPSNGRLVRVEASGFISDDNGNKKTMLHRYDAATDAWLSDTWAYAKEYQSNGARDFYPYGANVAAIPFSPSGTYSWTTIAESGNFSFLQIAEPLSGFVNPAGEVLVKYIDLGIA